MYRHECEVLEVEHLKMPKVYRLKCSCSDEVEIVFEMHEELMKVGEGARVIVDIDASREECLERDFCGRAHVVSISELDDKYRVVLSIGGLLVIVKNLVERPSMEPVQEVYVGLSVLKQ